MTSKTQRPKGQAGKVVSGQLGIPTHEAGLYNGRIEQLDPMRRQERAARYAEPGMDHNMTNFTPVRLSEDSEGDDDAVLKGDTPLSEGIPGPEEDPNMQGYSDPSTPDALPHELGNEIDPPKPGCGCGSKSLRAAKKMLIPIEEDASPDQAPQKIQGPRRPDKITFQLDENGLLQIEEILLQAGLTVTAALNTKESAWWKSMSPTAKREYLKRHPNSKYGKAYRRAQLRKSARKNNGKNSGDPEIVQTLDEQATENQEAGVPSPIPEQLDNDQDEQLDELNAQMEEAQAESDQDEDEENSEEEDGEEENEKDPEPPVVDPEAGRALGEASKRPGFFSPVVKAITQRASKSTLGAMSRAIRGKMEEGDKEKVARGLTLMASAILVVGLSAGVGAIAGPGVMAQFASDYANHVFGAQSDGEGFDFFGTASSEDVDPDIMKDLDKLSRHFTQWLVEQTQKGQEA